MESKVHVYPEGCYFKSLEDIKDKHITIMGLGLNGGGEASVKFFLRHGAYVTVTDMKSRQELEPTILSITNDPELDRSRLTYVLGQHRMEDFSNADCVIKTPGVKFEGNQYLQAANWQQGQEQHGLRNPLRTAKIRLLSFPWRQYHGQPPVFSGRNQRNNPRRPGAFQLAAA